MVVWDGGVSGVEFGGCMVLWFCLGSGFGWFCLWVRVGHVVGEGVVHVSLRHFWV